MNRRRLVTTAGTVFVPIFVGCLEDIGASGRNNNDNPSRNSDGNGTEHEDDQKNSSEERVKKCEEQFIRNQIVSDDSTVDTVLPKIIQSESTPEGDYVTLKTYFGGERQGNENKPDEEFDGEITARYLVTEDEVYRTDDPNGDPRDGTKLNC